MPPSKAKRTPARNPTSALSFFIFPREIREQIYNYVLCESPCKNVQLLRTCKQIASESQRFLFRRPLTFWSQSQLSQWIQEVDPRHLQQVSCVQIKIDNPVSHESIERLCLTETDDASLSPLAQLFKEEDKRIGKIFDQIPDIRDMTLLRSKRDSPYCIWQNMYYSFSLELGQRYPNLRRLAFHVHKVSLNSLAGLKSLRSFRFTGFSTSTPQETLKVLSSLGHLEELEIVGIPHRINAEPSGQALVRSFTPEVLRGLRPLKSFKICETYTLYTEPESVFASTDMLTALYDTHVDSLISLGLSTCIALSPAAAGQLKNHLTQSSLQSVRLCSSPLDPTIIDALPSSVRDLQVCVDPSVTKSAAVAVLKTLKRKAQSESLNHVDWAVREPFKIPGVPPCPLEEARIKLLTKAAPMGFRVTSRTWHPFIFDDEEIEEKIDLANEVPAPLFYSYSFDVVTYENGS
ncbi:MAG: Pre-mRNA-splicing factor slt11 [Chaenotheca gracillima]|nr:MAG: Pre-mRNA-splicing factor slt11 [Chaenotheca gracillima]